MDDSHLALVEQARNGSSQAWDALWRQFGEVALALAYGRLGDRSLAADVAQEAFRVAIEKIKTLDDPRRFPGWLRTITLNLATKHGQRKRSAAQLPEEIDPAARDHSREQAISNRCIAILLPLLQDILPRLSSMHQTIVQMSFLQGLSDTAIAPIVQRNNGSVGRAKTKALEQLKDYMREAGNRHTDARECVEHLLG
jgi:RNA polymerase sigma-70 factor (ECF subfamily)